MKKLFPFILVMLCVYSMTLQSQTMGIIYAPNTVPGIQVPGSVQDSVTLPLSQITNNSSNISLNTNGTVQVTTNEAFLAQINLYAVNKGTQKIKLEVQLTVQQTGVNNWFFFDLEPNGQYVSCSTKTFSINPTLTGTDNPILRLSVNNDTTFQDINVLIGGCPSCPDYAWELVLTPFSR